MTCTNIYIYKTMTCTSRTITNSHMNGSNLLFSDDYYFHSQMTRIKDKGEDLLKKKKKKLFFPKFRGKP